MGIIDRWQVTHSEDNCEEGREAAGIRERINRLRNQRSIPPHQHPPSLRPSYAEGPYVELADTLKTGTKFAPEERAQMRQQLLADAAAIQEVLALLEEPAAGGPRAH